jgi:hypothetical protein
MFQNDDCLSLILSDLCYVDQLSLKLSCHNRIILNFKKIFIQRLIKDKIVPEELTNQFCDELYKTGAYVAGSFILDCLYDTNHHNDIDIYDQTELQVSCQGQIPFIADCFGFGYRDDNLQFTQALYKMGFFSKHNTCGASPLLRNYLHSNFYNEVEVASYKSSGCEYVYDIKNKIQIIPIGLTPNKKSFIPKFINASFDLDICQSIFDGEKIYIKNVNKIIEKYDYIKPNTRFMLTVYPQQINVINDVTDLRMKKYQEKGFNIQKHPKFNEINQHIQDIIESNRYKNFHHYMINYIDDGSINLSYY